jgi:hypothetical protein
MSKDDQNGSDPNPGDEILCGPFTGKSALVRRLVEQMKRQLEKLGVPGPRVLRIRPGDYANVFTEHTDLKIGPALEAAKRLVEAEGHQVILVLDEVDDVAPNQTDDEEEVKES